jgi:beta-glucosidase
MTVTHDDLATTAQRIVASLDLATKIRLLSGAGMWATEAVDGVPRVLLANGPNGLGKQASDGDHIGGSAMVPATCFPVGAALGSTWDVPLLEEVGAAMGREARAEGVGVLLGPGLNIKRHPGGGRVFEYLSEDPFLSGTSAAALVRGVQSEGVGASVKHFAGNNQETGRMRLDSVIDERTLREIYLTGFEIAVREGQPWTVMTSYNLVNGEHTGESRHLLSEILRGEWGFDGLVMTDWFAAYDRVAGLRAGLDLEMPGSTGAWDRRVEQAVAAGVLAEAEIDLAAERVVALSMRAARGREGRDDRVDREAHHALARRAAAAGTVLLRNDGLLPLASAGRIALIGAVAQTPRYQGVGSAHVNAWRVDTVLDAMRARLGGDAALVFAPGYDPVTGCSTPAQQAEAVAAAQCADMVVLMVGMPPGRESEGIDRTELALPPDLDALVRAVTAANSRTAVVLVNGAPADLPWSDDAAALLEAYLGGQAAGSAIVDVLLGDAEPGGRLAETFPMDASLLPASANFPTTATQVAGTQVAGTQVAGTQVASTQVQYREGLYVGYRFHDSFDVAPRFPFGHGLSYTTFAYGDVAVEGTGTDLTVVVPVTNTGRRAGSDVVQLYVHDVESSLHRPAQELKGFAKVHLQPGETRNVRIALGRRAFAVYDVSGGTWVVEAGQYELRVGASSRDIRAAVTVDVSSGDIVTAVAGPVGAVATDEEFETLLGRPVPAARPLLPYTTDSTVDDLRQTWLGRRLRGVLMKVVLRQLPDAPDEDVRAMIQAVVAQMALRALVANAGGKLSFEALDRLLWLLNATSLAGRARRTGDGQR